MYHKRKYSMENAVLLYMNCPHSSFVGFPQIAQINTYRIPQASRIVAMQECPGVPCILSVYPHS